MSLLTFLDFILMFRLFQFAGILGYTRFQNILVFLETGNDFFIPFIFPKRIEYVTAVRQLWNFVVLQVKLKRYEQFNVQRNS